MCYVFYRQADLVGNRVANRIVDAEEILDSLSETTIRDAGYGASAGQK
jgi:hypothetical protein